MADPSKRPSKLSDADASPFAKPKNLSEPPPAETARAADSVPAPIGPFARLPVRFGRYEIRKELGRGQMGAVYLAKDMELDRLVALKVARVSASGSAKILKRMEVEAKSAARIDHPLICKVYDAGEIDGIRFIALQYIEGEDLKQYMKRVGRKRPVEESIRLILQILRALEAAHEQGVIHRDLKPDNVMLNKNHEPVIMDFGLARQTIASSNAGLTQGMIVGTAAYMSPEQATGRSDDIDHRSDIYAVGSILFELLTGEWPFTGSAMEVMGKKCIQDPPSVLNLDPTIHPQLAAICQKMIAKQKVDRYVTCAEAIEALNAIQPNATSRSQYPANRSREELHSLSSSGSGIKSGNSNPVFNFENRFPDEPISTSMVRGRNKSIPKKQDAPRIPAKMLPSKIINWWNTDPMATYWTSLAGGVALTLFVAGAFFLTSRNGINRNQENALKGKSEGVTVPEPAKLPQNPREISSQTTGMKFVLIPSGEFEMGSKMSIQGLAAMFSSPEAIFQDEFPAFRTSIDKPFYMGIHEVTVGQFRQFVESDSYRTDAEKDGKGGRGFDESKWTYSKQSPKFSWRDPGFSQSEDHPVVNVSWNDAQRYCKWLSQKDGAVYRLPTEAEWEYACKAGTETMWSNGDDPERVAKVGNIADGTASIGHPNWKTIKARDGFITTSPVGQFAPNAFGLYDMHGNVGEWCEDFYDSNAYKSRLKSTNDFGLRVLRGGSWFDDARKTRSSYRSGGFLADYRDNCFGFRIIRDVVSEKAAVEKLNQATSENKSIENKDLRERTSDTKSPVSFEKTTSGLKYRILRQGTGSKPNAKSTIEVHYKGWLDSGQEFDNSQRDGKSKIFSMPKMIRGCVEGLQLISEGGIIELEVPPSLGYGQKGSGPIPANANLHFQIELLKVF